MWLQGHLIWLYDVSQWSGNTIQGLWWTVALAATTNEQFAYVWPLASKRHSINHTSAIEAVGSEFCCSPFTSLPLQPLSLCSISLSCSLSPSALSVFLCSPSMPPFPPRYLSPPLSSVSRKHLSFHRPAQTVDSQRQRNAFTLRGALHLTAGAEAGLHAPTEGEWGWCWRGTTVRLSSALVPLEGTCIVGRYFTNNLPYLSLIFKRNILTVYSPSFPQTKPHCVQSAVSHFLACGCNKFKGMVWNMTSSKSDVIWGRGEKV